VASRQDMPPGAASANDTTGLKCAPDTGPNIKMMANSPAAVAAAFSSSCSPVFPGGQLLRGDPGADHDRGEKGTAEELRGQAAGQQDRCTGHAAILTHA